MKRLLMIAFVASACGGKKDDGVPAGAPVSTAPTGLPAGVTVKPWTAIPDPPGEPNFDAKKFRVNCDAVLTDALLTKHFSEMQRLGLDQHMETSGTLCQGFGNLDKGRTEKIGINIACGNGKADHDQRIRIANAWATSTDESSRESFGGDHFAVSGLGRSAIANKTVLAILDDDTDCTIELELLINVKSIGGTALVDRVAQLAVDIVKNLTPAAITTSTAVWAMSDMRAFDVDCAPIQAAIEKTMVGAKVDEPGKHGDWGTACPKMRLDRELMEVTVICFADRSVARRSVDTWPGRADYVKGLGTLAQARAETLDVIDDDTGCAIELRGKNQGDPVEGKTTLASRGELVRAVLAAFTPAQIKPAP